MELFTNSDHIRLDEIRKDHLKWMKRCYAMGGQSKQEKAAAISALVKSFKREVLLVVVDRLAALHDLDMTVASGRTMTKIIMGRSISTGRLQKQYGTAGRGPDDRSAVFEDPKLMLRICEPVRDEFKSFIDDQVNDLKFDAGASASVLRMPM